MGYDDRSTSSQDAAESSDDDSCIDLYEDIERQVRRATRRESSSDDDTKSPPQKSKGHLGSFLETNQRTSRQRPGNRSVCSAPVVSRKQISSDVSVGSRRTSSSRRQLTTADASEHSRSQHSNKLASTSAAHRSSCSSLSPKRNTPSLPRRSQSVRGLLQPSSAERASRIYASKRVSAHSPKVRRDSANMTSGGERKGAGETVFEAKLREIRSDQDQLRRRSRDIKRRVSSTSQQRESYRTQRSVSSTRRLQERHPSHSRLSDTLVSSSAAIEQRS